MIIISVGVILAALLILLLGITEVISEKTTYVLLFINVFIAVINLIVILGG